MGFETSTDGRAQESDGSLRRTASSRLIGSTTDLNRSPGASNAAGSIFAVVAIKLLGFAVIMPKPETLWPLLHSDGFCHATSSGTEALSLLPAHLAQELSALVVVCD